jgi:hypothetical protein
MFSQKMRCGNCGHTAEEPFNGWWPPSAKEWYQRARSMIVCPKCNQKKYALSAYTDEGIEKLRNDIASRGAGDKIAGSWYCTPSGQLAQW